MNHKHYWEINQADTSLIEYTNIFMGNLVWMKRGIDKDIATYDLVVREMPKTWSFYVLDGVERLIHSILDCTFDETSIQIMKSMNLIDSPEVERFYRDFKFTGTVSAMKDGTIFFPGEPIARIVAPVTQANMFTALTLNAFGYPTRLLTKCVRVSVLAKGNSASSVSSGSAVRLPGLEHAVYSMRAEKILKHPIVTPVFYRKFPEYLTDKRHTVVNVNHAVIKSFPTEPEAFEYVLSELGTKGDLFLVMIDTYDIYNGIENFIKAIKSHPQIQRNKFMVTIDSGDIYKLSKYVRKRLDQNGCADVKIQVFSNLDEYKIQKLVKKNAPIDLYIAGTELVNITDNPRFEAVYKMAELRKQNGEVEYKAKLTKGKESYPGRKQVFRVYKEGKMVKDIIGHEDESLGTPLLFTFIKDGQLVLQPGGIEETRVQLEKELASLPDKYKNVSKGQIYPVSVSEKILGILQGVKKKHII